MDPPRPNWSAARQKLAEVFSRKPGEDAVPVSPLNVEAARLVETLYRIGDELEKQIGLLSAGGADLARAFATEVLVLAEEFAEVITGQGAYSKANQVLSRIQALVGEIGKTAVESNWRHPGDAVFDEYYDRAPIVRARLQTGGTL